MIKVAVIGNTNCLCPHMSLVSKYSDYDVLLVSYMSLKMLAECALGINEDFCTAFLKNKPIYVLKDGVRYKSVSDIIVYRMYCGYCQKLKSFGVKFVNSAEEIKL